MLADKLFSEMSLKEIQSYADEQVHSAYTTSNNEIRSLYILIANLSARIQELEKRK